MLVVRGCLTGLMVAIIAMRRQETNLMVRKNAYSLTAIGSGNGPLPEIRGADRTLTEEDSKLVMSIPLKQGFIKS